MVTSCNYYFKQQLYDNRKQIYLNYVRKIHARPVIKLCIKKKGETTYTNNKVRPKTIVSGSAVILEDIGSNYKTLKIMLGRHTRGYWI
jgi:hypothetical protein